MFPNDVLESRVEFDTVSMAATMHIKLTTKQRQELEKLTQLEESKQQQLHRFIQAHRMSGTEVTQTLKQYLEHEQWQEDQIKFQKLIEDPQILLKSPEVLGETFPEHQDLISFLASKVAEQTDANDYMLLTRVVDLVSQLQKPVILHNGIMDLMFLYDKFYEPLPDTALQFTTRLNSLLPHIYDTKHLINTKMTLKSHIQSNQGLGEAFVRVMQPDFGFNQIVKLHPAFNQYSLDLSVEADCKHEAGYDAMMTGVLWFKLQSILAHPTQGYFPGV
jgi:hypothetical protein